MTGIAVIEHRDSIKYDNIAIDNIAVNSIALNNTQEIEFILDAKKIKQLQEELKSLNLYRGKISGRLNRELKKAITKYQKNEGLTTSGTITKDLYDKIFGLDLIGGSQLELPFEQKTTESTLNTTTHSSFLPFFTYPVNQIHTSQAPKVKDRLYAWSGKDDFLYIGIFMILIAISIIAGFFFSQ